MQYKTIVLELLKERTELHEQLRLTRRLLPTMETCSRELKASHETWKEMLTQANPGSDPSQIASEALELAIKELEDRLPTVSQPDDREPLSLDQAMASVAGRTSKSKSVPKPVPAFSTSNPTYSPTDTRPPPQPTATERTTARQPVIDATPPNGGMASGEKAKARDIIAAIRTLKPSNKKTGRQRRRETAACPVLRFWSGRPLHLSRSGHRQI